MPVKVNKIGHTGTPDVWAEFFDLVGVITPLQQDVEVIDRPGVDGIGARLTGKRGKPFELKSITYHVSFAAAATALNDYTDLKTSVQTLIRNGVTIGNVVILEVVEATPPQAVYNVAGSPGSQVRAEVQWKLARV